MGNNHNTHKLRVQSGSIFLKYENVNTFDIYIIIKRNFLTEIETTLKDKFEICIGIV